MPLTLLSVWRIAPLSVKQRIEAMFGLPPKPTCDWNLPDGCTLADIDSYDPPIAKCAKCGEELYAGDRAISGRFYVDYNDEDWLCYDCICGMAVKLGE